MYSGTITPTTRTTANCEALPAESSRESSSRVVPSPWASNPEEHSRRAVLHEHGCCCNRNEISHSEDGKCTPHPYAHDQATRDGRGDESSSAKPCDGNSGNH